MIGANVLNVGLNWLMIGGRLGVPEMGAEGAALATSLARLAMVAGLLVWMLRLPEFAPWRGRLSALGPGRLARPVPRCGGSASPAAPPTSSRPSPSPRLAQAAGLLGATALAAYTILHNIEAMVFMIALGLSVGTAVRIGQAAGAGDRAEARFAGLAGLAAAMGARRPARPRAASPPRRPSSASTAPTRR